MILKPYTIGNTLLGSKGGLMEQSTGTVELQTDRLKLRRFAENDAEEMYSNWASDEDVSRYMRWQTHKNLEETRQVIGTWVKEYAKPDFYLWAITLKDSGELIGSIGIICVNANDCCYEVGYNIGKRFWNKGYVTEALRAVIGYALKKDTINRIEACHSLQNPASGKVMEKCGMTYEGRARQKYRSSLGFEDCDCYAILKDDVK